VTIIAAPQPDQKTDQEPPALPGPTGLLAPRLSPSRASDFKTCPQKFKFKVVDQLPEPGSIYTVRGTLVHSTLEALFLLTPRERTLAVALDLFTAFLSTAAEEGEMEGLFADAAGEARWEQECRRVLTDYFAVEDPSRFEPVGREVRIEAFLPGVEVRVVGILDRVGRRYDGSFVVTDYKTGAPPALQYANKNFFGLVIYAWLFRQTFGVIPQRLRLLFLDAPEVYSLDPDERKIDAMVMQLSALWKGIERAYQREDWRPRPSALCDYCAFRACCPAWTSPAAEVAS